ncbi:hypothetical protein RHSIM_Rhsim12G0064800 [Rhododendron simsii]|uniref:Uncharacterized protein n=1 Tax=Rhododendron simsii TaxID=118357 RepID=A0A834G5M8_RHOSS|nr:hypothetical protein RHSIM_Rhsim12G0064800 [Rhododendron simsii]
MQLNFTAGKDGDVHAVGMDMMISVLDFSLACEEECTSIPACSREMEFLVLTMFDELLVLLPLQSDSLPAGVLNSAVKFLRLRGGIGFNEVAGTVLAAVDKRVLPRMEKQSVDFSGFVFFGFRFSAACNRHEFHSRMFANFSLMDFSPPHQRQSFFLPKQQVEMALSNAKVYGFIGDFIQLAPSLKLEDSEFAKNSLLASKSGDFDDEVSSSEVSSVQLSSNAMPEAGQADLSTFQPKENTKLHQFSKSDSSNSSAVHPVRSLSRNMPSKWNGADKWIMKKQNVQNSYSKKSHMQSQVNKLPVTNTVRVAPELGGYDQKLVVKRVDFCQPTSQFGMEKFSFVPAASHPTHGQASGANVGVDLCPESKDLKKVDNGDSSCTKSTSTEEATGESSHFSYYRYQLSSAR